MRRIFLFVILTLLFIMADFTQAQTAVSDSGSAYMNGPFLLEQTINGTLRQTDTVISKQFDRRDYDSTFTLWYVFTSATDSVNCKVLFQGAGITNNWVTLATLSDSIKVETPGYINYAFRQTANKYRFILIGRSGNGYTTQFKLKAILRKE